MSTKFNHKDYLQNQGKYKLFKTAVVDCTILNEVGVVNKGTVVGLEHVEDAWSPFYQKTLPLYKLSTGDYCWGNKLTNFVL
jgi:hypothetical protein